MADVMKLTDGSDTVNFSPLDGYDNPGAQRVSIHEAKDGTLYVYTWGQKSRYEPPINNISSTDAEQLNVWWAAKTQLTFYPDLENDPSGTVSVRIINEERPMQMMFLTWANKYEGTLILRQSN